MRNFGEDGRGERERETVENLGMAGGNRVELGCEGREGGSVEDGEVQWITGKGGGDGGVAVPRWQRWPEWRRRRLEDGGIAMTVKKNCGRGN